jgi:hypothetical protein
VPADDVEVGMATRQEARKAWLVIPMGVLAVSVAACGSDQKNASMDDIFVPVSAVSEDAYGPKPPTTSHQDSPSSTSGGGAASGLNDEQKDQIRLALKRGGDNAAKCPTSVTAPKTFGEGDVQVTFDGSTGRISEVSVGAPFGGSELEPCIKKSFMNEYSLKFDGKPLTVPYTIKVVDPKAPADKKPKK